MRLSQFVPTLVLVALLLLGAAGFAESGPGNRPDSRPMLFSLERKIIKDAGRLHGIKEEFAKALEELQAKHEREIDGLVQKWNQAPDRGLPLLTDSKRDYDGLIRDAREDYEKDRDRFGGKYGDRITAQQGELGDALASPPDDAAGERIELYKSYSASREQLELHNAALNLQTTANTLMARLRADRANYELAVETYDVMLELVVTVIEMNTGFMMRIDQQYRPEAGQLMDRLRRAKSRTQNARDVDPEVVQRELEKLTAVLERMEQNLPKLKEMRTWAEDNVASLDPIISTVQLLKENATVVRDVADWVGGIEESFAQLNISLPPLVEYDLVESDFEITVPEALE